MASRLGQHLVRAKSKTENFGLLALYSSYLFFYLLFDYPMANFWLLSSKQSHSPNVNHCIWAISFWPKAGLGGVGSLHLTEFPVSFDHNVIIPQNCKKSSAQTAQFSQNVGMPPIPKTGIA